MKTKWLLVVLVVIVGFGWAVLSGAELFSTEVAYPKVLLADGEVPLAESSYGELDKKRVRGLVVGQIGSQADLTGQEVVFCRITDGKVYEVGGRRTLECEENSIKTSVVSENNTFEMALYSGFYFLDLPGLETVKSNSLPVRVSVHKGKEVRVEIGPD